MGCDDKKETLDTCHISQIESMALVWFWGRGFFLFGLAVEVVQMNTKIGIIEKA